jgi:putative heme degradation protein
MGLHVSRIDVELVLKAVTRLGGILGAERKTTAVHEKVYRSRSDDKIKHTFFFG